MFTWGEIQLETCKKMFLNSDVITTDDLDNLRLNNNYKTYFNGMAQAANEGIAEILKRGKPMIHYLNFVTKTTDNLLGDQLKTYEHTKDDIVFDAEKGLAYSFLINGYGTAKIYVNDVLVKTIDNQAIDGYYTYKGYLTNTNNDKVKIVFTGTHLFKIKNICIYEYDYDYEGDQNVTYIPEYTNEDVLQLDVLTQEHANENVYKIFKIYYNGRELINNTDYKVIDYHIIRFNHRNDGDYVILYQPYPEKISDETEDSYELPLEYETAVLLPLYMASQLYKDDDISLSTIYRNEFEAAVDDTYPLMSDLVFIDKSGWL